MKFEKTKEFILSVKSFNITKYLLDKKEINLQNEIMRKEDEISFFVGQIARDECRIVDSRSSIIILRKEIEQLEKDIKKLVKVINLYID